MVAPRSITACAKSPGRSRRHQIERQARISGFAFGSGSSTMKRRDTTRSTLPSTAAAGLVERDGSDRRRRVGADSRQGQQFGLRGGKFAAEPLDDRLGAGMKVAGAGVIAEPGPGLHDLIDGCFRQGLTVGKRSRKRR